MRLNRMGWMALLAAAALFGNDTVRLSEAEAKKAIVSKVDPQYPQMARQMHLTGRVVVDVYIDEDGSVDKVQTLNGNALLTSAAANAVKRWKFTPFTSGGHPSKAVTSLAFDFRM
ncbi:MAG: energy transducer TonB [Bryobacteraceae bacterium]